MSQGNSPDEEHVDPHGECAAEIARLKVLESLAREHNVARKAVTDWLNAQGAAGQLCEADKAPGWAEYRRTREALDAAIAEVK